MDIGLLAEGPNPRGIHHPDEVSDLSSREKRLDGIHEHGTAGFPLTIGSSAVQ
jgi:hypothetical protein